MAKPAFHVLIAAAGTGERFSAGMGAGIPKQYMSVNGKPLLRHTLDIFLNHPTIASLRVIINPEHLELYHDAVTGLSLPPPIYGSKDRKSSVYNGLKELSHLNSEDIVLIHDAVRPFVSHDDIDRLLARTSESGAATLATPLTDTIRHDSGNYVARDGLHALQTPQGFYYGIIRAAHEAGRASHDITDDTGLAAAFGIEVALVEGSRNNIKITRTEDMTLARKLLEPDYDVRTGTGFDVHAFEKGRPLILCGVEVEHTHGLAGHSDADVALHAITDALLGAIAEGDIGHHFPPSDAKFKNMSSDVFLKHAAKLAADKGAVIQNIDLTIICEAPKIGPYRERMQARVAEILDLPVQKIGIKATTTEQLGFTGRGEGIAAQAIATVKIPAGA